MVALLSFLRVLLTYLASLSRHNIITLVAKLIPKSFHSFKKSTANSKIKEYAVCPKCHVLYEISECIIKRGGQTESKCCDFVKFPKHPHVTKRSKCNTPLMKWIRIGSKSKLVPKKVFYYHSVIIGLETLISRKGFLQLCEQWRSLVSFQDSKLYTDIYDGQVWESLQNVHGSPFLTCAANLCLMLNIDWFNPFTQVPYSMGAIYLVVQNLPRSERFKTENIILVGLIPGPSEPPKTINTYLVPLVDDLCKLFRGVDIPNPHSVFSKTKIRAILSCIVCDLPATRKVCGFLGINATKGCSKCLKSFPTSTFGTKPDYSGYDCDLWEPRTFIEHYQKAMEAKNANTATERTTIERTNGARYTELLRLPYFDVIRYHVIDPMHNLFLGIAKHAVSTWKDLNILRSNDFNIIQSKVDSILPPTKIGRIPRKISSGFDSFTAEQWKNWILVYSVFALKDVLPPQHYRCWCLFVDACILFCQLVITPNSVTTAHKLLVLYCKKFQELYGISYCTPNMHMACHIHANITDYGPLAAFWAFSFERYNGTLENMKMSWCGPEKQLLKKFLDLQHLNIIEQSNSNEFLQNIYSEAFNLTSNFTSVEQMSVNTQFLIEQKQFHSCDVYNIDATNKPSYKLLSPLREKCFSDTEMEYIEHLYKLLYPGKKVTASRFYYACKKIIINGEEFITNSSQSACSPAIIAHWPGVIGIDVHGEAPVRVGILSSIFINSAVIQNVNDSGHAKTIEHVLTNVLWLQDHPQNYPLHPSIIVTSTVYDDEGCTSFMPVSRIIARCALAKVDYGQHRVCICIPLLKICNV